MPPASRVMESPAGNGSRKCRRTWIRWFPRLRKRHPGRRRKHRRHREAHRRGITRGSVRYRQAGQSRHASLSYREGQRKPGRCRGRDHKASRRPRIHCNRNTRTRRLHPASARVPSLWQAHPHPRAGVKASGRVKKICAQPTLSRLFTRSSFGHGSWSTRSRTSSRSHRRRHRASSGTRGRIRLCQWKTACSLPGRYGKRGSPSISISMKKAGTASAWVARIASSRTMFNRWLRSRVLFNSLLIRCNPANSLTRF